MDVLYVMAVFLFLASSWALIELCDRLPGGTK